MKFIIALVVLIIINFAWIFGGEAFGRKLGFTGSWSTYKGQMIMFFIVASIVGLAALIFT